MKAVFRNTMPENTLPGMDPEQLYFRQVNQTGSQHCFELEVAMLPYLFHLSELALSQCRLSPEARSSYPLAEEIF